MKINEINTVGIIGAGTMGEGIAYIAAKAGYQTKLYDLDISKSKAALKNIEKIISKGLSNNKITKEVAGFINKNLTTTDNLNEMVCDIVIEAIVEKLEIKKVLFQQLENINDARSLLVSNTSSIPITQIASAVKNPGRVAGLHFFNPAHIMKLVEVISGADTLPENIEVLKSFSRSLDKVPVVAKDSPGFIVNRVARHYYVESLKILEENVASVEDIDALMEATGFKMGPFKLMDLIGIDTNYSVTSSMFESFNFDPKFRPNRIQKQKIDAGHLGKKSGKGFYSYE